ncbi:MAG: MIP/aquaporin family protein [Gammaproteobacteria bacterium]|nr:MIP/aquaporin family protein [Gammaproteobacteria bacterium]
MSSAADLPRRLAAELVGTAGLLATVVGSGIMAERLAGGNVAVALLGNTIPTGAILVVLILVFAPISGAHFNPAVSLAFFARRELPPVEALLYVIVQVAGGLIGVAAAHLMFEQQVMQISLNPREGPAQWFSESIATFGLVATILGTLRWRPEAVAYAVGLFISAGYWFTASTSFANPAVTVARSFTDTFTGIRPVDAPGFIVAECVGALIAVAFMSWLFASRQSASTINTD